MIGSTSGDGSNKNPLENKLAEKPNNVDSSKIIPKDVFIKQVNDGDYFIKVDDLNGDKMIDFILINRGICGSSGCALEIYSEKIDGFVNIFGDSDALNVDEEGVGVRTTNIKTNGYFNIMVNKAKSEYDCMLVFDGNKYQTKDLYK